MGIFSCCYGDRKTDQNEKDRRHARIVEIYRQAQDESSPSNRSSTQAPPPAYHEVIYDSCTGTTLILDRKEALPTSTTDADPIPRPVSPQTSIYSVPSTRLTDLTSIYTGHVNHTHRNDSPRSSLAFESAPPSYYDGRSLRARSPSLDGRRSVDDHTDTHPVMSVDWLQVLQRNVHREHDHGNG